MPTQPSSTTARCTECGMARSLQMMVKLRSHPGSQRERLLCPSCIEHEFDDDDDDDPLDAA
jgi:hypothetical protein